MKQLQQDEIYIILCINLTNFTFEFYLKLGIKITLAS